MHNITLIIPAKNESESLPSVLNELKQIKVDQLSEENSLNYYLFLEKTENELKDFKFTN